MTAQLEIAPHPLYRLNPPLSSVVLEGLIALDLETTDVKAWRDKIKLIAIKSGEDRILIQPEFYRKSELTDFFLRMSDSLIVCHNTKFDGGFIYTHYGVLLENLWCTLLGSQILQGGLRKLKHGLLDCVTRYLDVDLGDRETKKKFQQSFGGEGELTSQQFEYAINDVEHLLPMRAVLIERLAERGLEKIVLLENKLTPIIIEMEARGCLIDVAAWRQTLKDWQIKHKEIMMALDAEYIRLYPYVLFANIKYGSPKQILGLFKKMGLKVPTKKERKGAGGDKEEIEKESVDEDTINNYINENQDSPTLPFLKLLIDYREYDKLLSTYGDSMLASLDASNHIHTTYSQCTTTTGRFSSSAPNLQNIPSDKSGAGSIIRTYFVAGENHKLVTCDMSGAEITIAADFSKDSLLLRTVTEDIDMHSHLATISFSTIFGQRVNISKSEQPITVKGHILVPGECRDIHKSVTFSKFYKGGPRRVYQILSRYINLVHPPKQRMRIAKQISEQLDAALPKLSRYLSSLIDRANVEGYLVTTKLGRRRYFDTKIYGEGANAPIQGSNADAMKIAMINIYRKVKQYGATLVLTVHDELVVRVEQHVAGEVAKIVQEEMAKALTAVLTDLTGKASVKIEDYWCK